MKQPKYQNLPLTGDPWTTITKRVEQRFGFFWFNLTLVLEQKLVPQLGSIFNKTISKIQKGKPLTSNYILGSLKY